MAVRYYEKLLLMPSECVAVTVCYKPTWVVSAVIPPMERTIIAGASSGNTTGKAKLKTPTLLWLHKNALSKTPSISEPSNIHLFAVKNENKQLVMAPYRLANVHEDGEVCWGNNKQPANLRAAHSFYFTSPFSSDLWDQEEDYYEDEEDEDEERTSAQGAFLDHLRTYEPGKGQQTDDDYNPEDGEVYGDAHVSFPGHVDAVFVSTRPKTLALFPKEAHRKDRRDRPVVIGSATRAKDSWAITVEGNTVTLKLDDKKAIKATTKEG